MKRGLAVLQRRASEREEKSKGKGGQGKSKKSKGSEQAQPQLGTPMILIIIFQWLHLERACPRVVAQSTETTNCLLFTGDAAQQSRIPEPLKQDIRLGKQLKGAEANVGVEKLLVSLFETSVKSIKHTDAVRNKLHDKTVSLHPLGVSQSALKKKHVPWRQGDVCVAPPHRILSFKRCHATSAGTIDYHVTCRRYLQLDASLTVY